MNRASADFEVIFKRMSSLKESNPDVQRILETVEESAPIRVLAEAVSILNSTPNVSYTTKS